MEIETNKFIEVAKEKIKEVFAGEPIDNESLKLYLAWANGKCAGCSKDLKIIETLREKDRLKYSFFCGHKYFTQNMSVVIKVKPSFEIASVKDTIDDEQEVQARFSGHKGTKEGNEITITKTFSSFFRPELVSFNNDEECSPVDVIALSEDKKMVESFQITGSSVIGVEATRCSIKKKNKNLTRE